MNETELARFEARITRTPSGCWIVARPYPRFHLRGRTRSMIHVSFEHFVGREVPPDMTLDHHDHCRDTHCVNPWHVELATRADNSANAWLSSPQPPPIRRRTT